jgi:hypothetical protein
LIYPFLSTGTHGPDLTLPLLPRAPRVQTKHHAANSGRGINELKSIADFGGCLGEQRSGISAAESGSLLAGLAIGIGIVSGEDLQRHERSPITMGITLLTDQFSRND